MLGGVCCYSGCAQPVVGQCQGHKHGCGRFFCHEHSSDNLCGICAQERIDEAENERMFADYLEAAKRVGRPGLGSCGGATLVFVSVIVGGILALSMGNAWPLIICFYLITPISWYVIHRTRKSDALITLEEEVTNRPGFREFHSEWLKRRNAEDKELTQSFGRAIAGTAVATISTAASASINVKDMKTYRQWKTAQDIKAIKNKLDDR